MLTEDQYKEEMDKEIDRAKKEGKDLTEEEAYELVRQRELEEEKIWDWWRD